MKKGEATAISSRKNTTLPLKNKKYPAFSLVFSTLLLNLHPKFALVAKLVDAPDLGSGVSRRRGSSPLRRTYSLR